MKFFIPLAEDAAQAERVYSAIAEFNGAQVTGKRVYSLSWLHAGASHFGSVGEPAPSYYGTGDEPILAILDCGSLFKVCTASRGGARGEAILVGRPTAQQIIYFE